MCLSQEKTPYIYKTEMHCHTLESSLRCGKVPAKEIVDAYREAGYDTLIVTDHFGGKHVSEKGTEYDICVFLEGFKTAQNYCPDFNVLLGMEINLCENRNDYLVYGITEEIIREFPRMHELCISDFCDFAHEKGLLVYQAHPFRNGQTIVPPVVVDGIESFNAHPRHDSRNSIAQSWAELYNKKTISGSDAHQKQDLARGGIKTRLKITNQHELLSVLTTCDYELITV